MSLKGKHVFFISEQDRFFYLFGDALICKLGVPHENIIPIVFKTALSPISSPRLNDVCYLDYENVAIENIAEAKSVTFMSLNKWNSPIAKRLLDYSNTLSSKIYIFITDDEVERWDKSFQAYGRLKADDKLHIAPECIDLLGKNAFFIAPKPYFYKKISSVCERDNLNFIDASIIFDILPTTYSDLMQQIMLKNFNYGDEKYKVLIDTKRKSRKEIVDFLKSDAAKKISVKAEFYCFVKPSRRVALDCYLFVKRLFGGIKFDVNYLSPMSPQVYNAFLASCTHLILQDRGGASTARLFAKWGAGRIAVRKNSPNQYFLEGSYGIELYVYNERSMIGYDFFDNDNFDPEISKGNVLAEEERSIVSLAKVYL
ncbi:hypothetical protein [Oceanimonas sp. CAM02]|uniref:hypothetical protein n=1 Tax=Oceanimonas sp. CAM02 TaxID=3080336 RepID=UPI002936BDC1|nr:hypothetical protein [Oceanimonas sp. CAM02]MDV2857693.1 hypothetical protein [Oceanimonas sp. CAM02]